MGEAQLQKAAVLVVISDDVASSLGEDGGGPTTKESRGCETARSQEKRQTIIKMGRLRNEGCDNAGGR